MPKYSNTFGNVKIEYLGKGKFDFDFKGQKLSEEDISNLETALLYRRSVMECAEYCCAFYHELNERRFTNFVKERKETIDEFVRDDDLIKRFANINWDFQRCEDIFKVVRNNDIEKAEALLEDGVDVNVERGGLPLLAEALLSVDCSPDMVSLLIKYGADTSIKTVEGHNLLQFFCINNPNPAVIKVLTDNGLDVNEKDIDGNTALLNACAWCNNVEVVKVLVENGADLTAVNNNGENCLELAVKHFNFLQKDNLFDDPDCKFDEQPGKDIIDYLQMQMGKIGKENE